MRTVNVPRAPTTTMRKSAVSKAEPRSCDRRNCRAIVIADCPTALLRGVEPPLARRRQRRHCELQDQHVLAHVAVIAPAVAQGDARFATTALRFFEHRKQSNLARTPTLLEQIAGRALET
jgi:hypothetical protein